MADLWPARRRLIYFWIRYCGESSKQESIYTSWWTKGRPSWRDTHTVQCDGGRRCCCRTRLICGCWGWYLWRDSSANARGEQDHALLGFFIISNNDIFYLRLPVIFFHEGRVSRGGTTSRNSSEFWSWTFQVWLNISGDVAGPSLFYRLNL